MSWIGPAECNEERTQREKEYTEVWKNLASGDTLRKTHLVFGEATDLLREAVSCYQNGAFMATCLMCRSATECAVYYALTRQNIQYSESWKLIHKTDVIPLKDDQWKSLVEEGRKRGILDDEMTTILDQIRDRGNFVAHYGSRKDKLLGKYSDSITVQSNISKHEEGEDVLSQIVFDKETALNNLNDAQKVLKLLMEKIISISNPSK